MQKKKILGLTSLEVLLSTIIIILIGAVGYLAYQNYIITAPAIDKNNAESMVETFYAKYYNSIKNGSDSRLIVSQYGTTNFINTFNASDFMKDPVLCAQDLAVAPPTIQSFSLVGKLATLKVQSKYANESVNMNVSVIDQNGLKIDMVTCLNK